MLFSLYLRYGRIGKVFNIMEQKSNSVDEVVTKKNNKAILVIVSIIVICALLGGIVYFASAQSPSAKLQKQLELGRQYLDDMDYERAVVAFESAISINPKSEEAYRGLADTYVAMAKQALVDNDIELALKYFEAAIDALQKGIDEIGSAGLENYRDEVKEQYDDLRENPDNGTGSNNDGGNAASDGIMSEDEFVAFLIENNDLDDKCMQTSISGHRTGFVDRYGTKEAYEKNYGPVIVEAENYIEVIKAHKEYIPESTSAFDVSFSGTGYYRNINDTDVYIHSLNSMYERLSLMYLYEGDLENCLRVRTEWAEFAGRPDLIQDGNKGFYNQEDLNQDKYGREMSGAFYVCVYNDGQVGAASMHEEDGYGGVTDSTYSYDSEGRISEMHIVGISAGDSYEAYIYYTYSGKTVTRTMEEDGDSFVSEFEIDDHCKEIY